MFSFEACQFRGYPRPMANRRSKLNQTARFLTVVHELRKKCPWDKKQTHRSLKRYLIEEAYETLDAIDGGNVAALREELGDLLLQVVLHAEIASEKQKFTFEEVAKGIADKMVRRHPHVFECSASFDAKSHQRNWTRLKEKEKPKRGLLAGIPRGMPGLSLAQRYGEIAASVGFDWSSVGEVFEKVKEELGELEVELRRRARKRAAVEMELGDLMFTLANLARHLGLDAEAALRRSAGKFQDRFTRLEELKRTEGRRLSDCTPAELEEGWNRVKATRSVSQSTPDKKN